MAIRRGRSGQGNTTRHVCRASTRVLPDDDVHASIIYQSMHACMCAHTYVHGGAGSPRAPDPATPLRAAAVSMRAGRSKHAESQGADATGGGEYAPCGRPGLLCSHCFSIRLSVSACMLQSLVSCCLRLQQTELINVRGSGLRIGDPASSNLFNFLFDLTNIMGWWDSTVSIRELESDVLVIFNSPVKI